MTSSYLIQFKKNGNDNYELAYIEVKKNYRYSTITINTENDKFSPTNKIMLNIYIYNKDNNMTYDDSLMECYINNSIIKFDENSSSAWSDFITNIKQIIETENQIVKYNSGNIMFIGDVITNYGIQCINGTGTQFYDTNASKIKYTGEFDNGMYDGSGTYYSYDEKIVLIANNISGGIPISKGKIKFSYKSYSDEFIIDFYNLWDHYKLITSQEKRDFVMSDKFTEMIAKYIETIAKSIDDGNKWKCDKTLEELKFSETSTDDKITYMYNRIKLLESIVIKQKEYIKKNEQEYTNFFGIILGLQLTMIGCHFMYYYKC